MMTREQAIDMFSSDDLVGIGMEADSVRRKLHPEGVVSYIIDRNINYTNFCTEYCSFCAFYRPMGHKEGYVQTHEAIFEKIQETIDLGGTGILMQGGLHQFLFAGEVAYRQHPAGISSCIQRNKVQIGRAHV